MKRSIFISIFFTLLLISLFPSYLTATEAGEEIYFGIGANVKEISKKVYEVQPEGKKPEEGFVYTPKKGFVEEQLNVELKLKGKGKIILKVSETDVQGRFIKEEEKTINLSEEWKNYQLNYQLTSLTSQIDILIVTKEKQAETFYFKDFVINK